jgi:hypothetical protein
MDVEFVENVEGGTDSNVFSREVVTVDEYFSNLVDVVRIFTVVWIVAFMQKAGVAALDDRDRVGLDFVYSAENVTNLGVKGGLGAEEDVAVGVRGVVALFHERGIFADLSIVAAD